ncbi:HAMP domain-containing protein [Paenibacillus sp. HJL G12]|uniref:HAMP domain-containing protein n=1 Tax=Paenibacillus dendrobii TaxID=2691084 RepID=A0A7X3INM7_9BACL|nr:sensor histidine kinase [Paenibacillus dendrobii]MWV45392.1 HAMP domain-containing protein [Paenibacillus dendrobii]
MLRRLRTLVQQFVHRLEHYSLQQRLFFSYIIIILIPSIVFSLIIFRQLNENFTKDVLRKSESSIEIEKTNIRNNMETMERAVQLALSDREVMYYLDRSSDPDTSELIEFSNSTVNNILRLQFNNPDIEHIRIFSDNPFISEIWPVFLKESRVQGEAWYEELNRMDGAGLWQISERDKEPIHNLVLDEKEYRQKMSLLREIEYPKGRHVGLIQIDMLLNNFFSSTYKVQDNGQSQMVIMNESGRLYYPNTAPLLSVYQLADAKLNERLHPTDEKTLVHFNLNLSGKPYLVVYTYIDSIHAYVVQMTSMQVVLAELNKTRNTILLVNVILIAILSVSTFFLNSLILKKLRQLTLSMKKIRLGDFNIQLPVGGGSEVGELTHHFRKMINKINELIADAVNKQAASKEAELKTLKNQIDSHFLYNTLENIKMLAEVENQQPISDALTSLGSMMRYNLRWSSEYVRLREEMSHIRHYVSLMNLRFDQRIHFHSELLEPDLDLEVLKMSLQPIIENAVKHGLRSSTSGDSDLNIRVKTLADKRTQIIVVEDDGTGMSLERTEQLNLKIRSPETGVPSASPRLETNALPLEGQSGNGIGLRNVHQRLQLFYGHEYGLWVESEEGKYTRVMMKVPNFNLNGGVA